MSELELLTPQNSTVIFIDRQPQMLFGVSNIDHQTLIDNVAGLAKATRVFDVRTDACIAQMLLQAKNYCSESRAHHVGISQIAPLTPTFTRSIPVK